MRINATVLMLLLTIGEVQAQGLFEQLGALFGAGEESPAESIVDETLDKTEVVNKVETTSETVKALLPTLTNSLGVTEKQANGGVGALLGFAKNQLGSGEFSSLSQWIPNTETLLKAAPAVTGKDSGLGGLLSQAGDYGKTLSGAATVYQQFNALGLDPAHVSQYITITLQFLQSEGGQSAVELFKKGMGSLSEG